jgi:type IV pilus assembly protein PilY1
MATRLRVVSFSALGVALAGVAGYFAYVFAVQGQGTLAQAPLNIETQIKPAFVMAVDDSGSMTFETLFTAQDGVGYWNSATASTNGYFNSNGTMRTSGTGTNHHLIPHSGARYRIGTNRYAIPPLDRFGFARSHEYNPQYFNPGATYEPWLNSDGTPHTNANTDAAGNANVTATRVDPRDAAPTINFTVNRRESGSAVLNFRVLNGTIMPAGTVYYTTDECGGLGTTRNTRDRWVTLASAVTVSANCEVGIEYFPAVFYLKTTTAAPAGFIVDNRVGPIAHAGGPNVDMYKYEIKPANYSTTAAYNNAIRNFANWFSYYGNRNRSMIASMTHSLNEVNNMRVGMFTINQHGSRDNPLTNAGDRVTMYDMAPGSAGRTSLYAQLVGLPASGGTPNRQAVQAMGQQFLRTDAGAPVQLACQKNAGMLFTDGYSNGGGPDNIGNIDGAMGYPFTDGNSNTLADIATRYYLTNLRPDLLAGEVPVPAACDAANPSPSLDCNRNPHMNFYGITLGATGRAWGVTHNSFSQGYTSPPTWPARTDDTVDAVDDIWHAAVNTRGEYINAYTPDDVTSAMRRILAAVGEGTTPSGSIALTGARVGAGSLSVSPLYASTNNGTDWYSRLTAQDVSNDPVTGVVNYSFAWEAASRLTAQGHAARRILANGAAGVVDFNSTNISLADLCRNGTPLARCTAAMITGTGSRLNITAAAAIDYLRGDTSLEVRNGGGLRDRTTILGDIVNSSIVVTSPLDDYGYRSIRNAGPNGTFTYPYLTSYKTFLDAKRSADRTDVFAGANDGMLHAFNGRTGNESFAYIPGTALGHMGNLLFPYNPADRNDQVFQHRYYVDGPITVTDAFTGGSWKTVLVGTAGAGGRGVFGLNITNPSAFAASNVLWEVSDRSADSNIRNNIGHVLGKPIVVPVKGSTGTVSWKAIFGNGYGSINNDAVLFVVDMGTGGVTTIRAEEAALAAQPNGLGNIVVVDRYLGQSTDSGRDGYGDTVYAADQNGAVWKFDLRSAAAQATPMFVATDPSGARQAILGGFDAASGPGGGIMLFFGTGSFSFEGDGADRQMQTLYGIIDRPGTTLAGRSSLVQQHVVSDAAGARATTTSLMTPGKLGWYLDLGVASNGVAAATGERFVGNPRIESGVVFFPTYEPGSSSGCGGEGANRLYGLSAFNGGAALYAVRIGDPTATPPGAGTGAIGLTTGGTAPVKDVAVMSTPRLTPLGEGATAAEQAAAVTSRCWMVVQVSGAPPMYMPRPCGRQSWRQVR